MIGKTRGSRSERAPNHGFWSPRDSSRRNHGWQEVPHSSPTHSRSDDRPGEHRAGRALTDSFGLSDRVADTVFNPDLYFDADPHRRITHGDSHGDIDTDGDATDIDSYGDTDTDRNATHIDSHGDADTDAAHSDSLGVSHGDGDSNTIGDTDGNADGDSHGDTDGSASARSFPLLQGRDNEGFTLVLP
ncbi:MAG: hypothetical protein JRE57_02225 [Deltaproteobacteria bacterium]|nr:hypothetical protein [Deltaproteobacteria bacterium]